MFSSICAAALRTGRTFFNGMGQDQVWGFVLIGLWEWVDDGKLH